MVSRIWDAIFAGGRGGDREVLRGETPVGGRLPLFREPAPKCFMTKKMPLCRDSRGFLDVSGLIDDRLMAVVLQVLPAAGLRHPLGAADH